MNRVRMITGAAHMHHKKKKGKGISIAFLDTGICMHPDLKDRILAFRDFQNGRTIPYDNSGHGTHVAGICCGNGRLSGGRYAGIAPEAQIVAAKVLDGEGNGSREDVAASVRWILENRDKYRIRILNVSVGAVRQRDDLNAVLVNCMEEAWDAGLTVVVAAGNMGPDAGSVTIPGNSKKVITVGAYDDCTFPNQCYSGRGPTADCICKPEISAPGSGIRSCSSAYPKNGQRYCIKSGTSMAAPVVSGAIALLLEQEPELSNVEVKMRLKSCAKDMHLAKSRQGWGGIDIPMLLT